MPVFPAKTIPRYWKQLSPITKFLMPDLKIRSGFFFLLLPRYLKMTCKYTLPSSDALAGKVMADTSAANVLIKTFC
jgi:hypothetical protein